MRWLYLLLWLGAMPASAGLPEGEYQQGQLVLGQVPSGTRVEVFGRVLSLTPDGHFGFGLDRDAPALVQMTLHYPDGREAFHAVHVRQRQYDVQRVDGVPQRTVTPSPADLQRIAEDNRRLKAARALDLPREDFLAHFIWPLHGPITGVFGSQRIYNGEPRQPHYGVDVKAPVGTVVHAPAPGRVTLVHPDMFYSGGTLIIDHGHGISSSFIHLSEVLVREGQDIRQGDPIARVGQTGRATGPHLDWRMNWFDQRIDPQLLVGPM